ncbi:MAG: hypothetical protein IJ775_00785 [Muribaculaceae bacterium]|nr:hypothetical protein [Muribaculaceae bacterium]
MMKIVISMVTILALMACRCGNMMSTTGANTGNNANIGLGSVRIGFEMAT